MFWMWGITRGGTPTQCWTIKIITTTNTAPMDKKPRSLGQVPTQLTKESCKSGCQTFKAKMVLGHTRVFFLQSQVTFKLRRVPKSVPTQGCQLCHSCLCWRCTQVGSNWQPDVILSCQVLPMQVWPNTIYYWAGSTRRHLQVVVLALLVLWPLLVPNRLVLKELNYWAGRYVCVPWTSWLLS